MGEAHTKDASPPITELQDKTDRFDPLHFVAPTEFVALPSKGTVYKEFHPLHNQETIEIRYMTAKDEDILSSRTLLKKGIAVERFMQNIIVDKKIKVEDMVVGDRNAVLIAARVSGYGSDYSTSLTCPNCNTKSEFTFDLTRKRTSKSKKPLYRVGKL